MSIKVHKQSLKFTNTILLATWPISFESAVYIAYIAGPILSFQDWKLTQELLKVLSSLT